MPNYCQAVALRMRRSRQSSQEDAAAGCRVVEGVAGRSGTAKRYRV